MTVVANRNVVSAFSAVKLGGRGYSCMIERTLVLTNPKAGKQAGEILPSGRTRMCLELWAHFHIVLQAVSTEEHAKVLATCPTHPQTCYESAWQQGTP